MNDLPVDLIAKILSFTTPRVVCRSSAVSKVFKLAAEFSDVWKRFLPSEFPEGFTAPEGLPPSKQLFFSLVDNPLLHHGSQLRFWLERSSGKKCYMIAARALNLSRGDDERIWQWISHDNTRFKEVAKLIHRVKLFLIIGKINKTLLSDDTRYTAYFVFKWSQPVEASLVMADTEHDDVLPPMVFRLRAELRSDGWHEHDDVQPSLVCLMRAELRSDGWQEVNFGEFNKRRGDMGELEMRLSKVVFAKKGLIVHGIEIRPLP